MQSDHNINAILFAAKWKRATDPQLVLPVFLGASSVLLEAWQGRTSWLAAGEVFATLMGFWTLLYFGLFRWQEVILLNDKARFVSYRLSKDVRYQNMRAISLNKLSATRLLLDFKLQNPRYSFVSGLTIPTDSCSHILQILAREAPQAEMNTLAKQWRDNTTE